MIILFPEEQGRCSYEQGESWRATTYWSRVLSELKYESGQNDFDQWLMENWKIRLIYSNSIIYTIGGVEIADETISMLLLKFPSKL